MKKRGKKIKNLDAYAPTLVALKIQPEVALAEQTAIMALTQDWGENRHFNVLWDCHAMLVFGNTKEDADCKAITTLSGIALENIRTRWEEHKCLRATGDELSALRAMVDFSADFWNRQSGKRFAEAYHHVTRCREMYAEKFSMAA